MTATRARSSRPGKSPLHAEVDPLATPATEEAAEVLADVLVRLAQEAAVAQQQTRTPA